MVWGSMSWRGLGNLAVISGYMDSEKYVETLQRHLLPQASAWFPSADWCFQQDGARCHTSKKSMEFFLANDIPLLPWAPSSPDMNPIENIWALLKKRVYEMGSQSKDELIANILAVAEDDSYWRPICQNLIESMTERVSHVLRNRGAPWC